MSKHPCWRYRRGEGGGIESRLFADIDDVPKNQGWNDSPAMGDAEAKPKPPRGKAK
jgi:hypothetical protein